MTVPALAPPLISTLVDALRRNPALDPPAGVPAALWHRALVGPAEEFLSRPGKALRTTIVELGAALGGGAPPATVAVLAETIELLHAGSLIVDDVEDGSDERRGAPALHHLVGAPVAINTGNWMYFWALARLGEAGLDAGAHAAAVAAAIRGLVDCHRGQALDLGVSIATLAVADVPAVVAATTRLKTGALTRMAAELGAIAAGAAAPARAAIGALGEGLGIGLQMCDDLGGLCAPARAGKGLEDLRSGRPTWPWAWLAERAAPLTWTRLVHRTAADQLAEILRHEIGWVGRRSIRAHLDGVLAAATAALGASPALAAVEDLVATVEASYG